MKNKLSKFLAVFTQKIVGNLLITLSILVIIGIVNAKITTMDPPVDDIDVTNKAYVDRAVGNVDAAGSSGGGGVACTVICNGSCPSAPVGYVLTQSSGASGAGIAGSAGGQGTSGSDVATGGAIGGRCANAKTTSGTNPYTGSATYSTSYSGTEIMCCYFASAAPSSSSSSSQVFTNPTLLVGGEYLKIESNSANKYCTDKGFTSMLNGSLTKELIAFDASPTKYAYFSSTWTANTGGGLYSLFNHWAYAGYYNVAPYYITSVTCAN